MKWFFLFPCWFLFNLLAYILAPILPAFALWGYGSLDNNNEKGMGFRLPIFIAWFDTPDNAITGDAGHRERTVDTSEYWRMVLWLWRNPAVGFEASVLNAQLASSDQLIVKGDPQVQDAPHGKEGYCLTHLGKYWNFVYIKRIGVRCIKLDLGWQLKTFAEGHPLSATARYAMSIRFPTFKQ